MRTEKSCGSCQRVFKEESDFLTGTSQWRVCSSENLWFNCDCGSTLMVPKGKFSWYSPTMSMGDEASSLFNDIAELQQLPHIPSAIMELQQMMLDEEISTKKLSVAVKKDPFLAAEVIRVCENLKKIRQGSSSDSSGKQSLEYAITFIGRKHLSNLVTAASIKSFKLETKVFDNTQFWHHSFLTAAICEHLAVEFFRNKVEKDRAYLAGSLTNIGKIVSAIVYPEAMDRVQAYVNHPKTQSTWPAAEKKEAVPSHCILGEVGAAFWGFPPFVSDAIKYHHGPPTQNSEMREQELNHIVCFANMLAHWINLEPHRIDEGILKMEQKYFNLSEEETSSLADNIAKKFA